MFAGKRDKSGIGRGLPEAPAGTPAMPAPLHDRPGARSEFVECFHTAKGWVPWREYDPT
jgi:hypothetical protein